MSFVSRSKQLFFSVEKIKRLSFFFSFIFMLIQGSYAQQYTRGIGKYPGDPSEDYSPSMKIDSVHYRNLALHRAAYQSDSYDYNLTAQLITDGIIETKLPGWLKVTTRDHDTLQRNGREHILDHHGSSQQRLGGSDAWVQNMRALTKLHREMEMPDIVTYKSLKQMMPQADIWPQSADWGLHDFTLEGAQRGENFNEAIEKSFGKVDNMKEWLSLAHWVEYQGYRAMFEAEAKYRMGLLLWMSHPAWPSLTLQTYDYYFDPTAAYFASKNAFAPLHIQWNPSSDSVEVVNYATEDESGLTAGLQLVNPDGTVQYRKEVNINCPEDSTVAVFPVVKPKGLNSVYFIKLNLIKGKRRISQNLYLRGDNQDSTWGMGDLKELMNLPKIKLLTTTTADKKGSQWLLTTTLKNNTKYPAFNTRLKVVGTSDGKRILPVIYGDNYITVLPGEQRVITMESKKEDARGEKPVVAIEGSNLK